MLEVAQRAGVSPATVSRVLSGRDGESVAPTTRARVLEAVKLLGYQPNPMAQALRLGRGKSVALLVGDIEQSVYSTLTKHLQTALESVGLELLLYNLGHREDRLSSLLERAVTLRLRGICIASNDRVPIKELKPRIEELSEAGIPVISIGQRLDRYGIASIVHDDAGASCEAVKYLIRQGRAPVAYLGRVRHSASGGERYRGYRKALAEAGQPLDERLVWRSEHRYRYEAGYEEMRAALDRGLSPAAVFAASDELALGAMAAALDRGIRIPEEMAFVGVGGVAWSAHVRPSLTTICGDPEAVGREVTRLLDELDEARAPALPAKIRMQLIVRGST